MRKSILLATALAFLSADCALAAPAPFSAAGEAVVSGSSSHLATVRMSYREMRRMRRMRRMRMYRMRRMGMRRAPDATEPRMVATPSRTNPAVNQGIRQHEGGH